MKRTIHSVSARGLRAFGWAHVALGVLVTTCIGAGCGVDHPERKELKPQGGTFAIHVIAKGENGQDQRLDFGPVAELDVQGASPKSAGASSLGTQSLHPLDISDSGVVVGTPTVD